MPGLTAPAHGIQALTATIQRLTQRIVSLEAWQRTVVAVHPGTITQYGGATAPDGALLCDGAIFDPAVFPALFAALGSTTLPNIPTTPITVIWT